MRELQYVQAREKAEAPEKGIEILVRRRSYLFPGAGVCIYINTYTYMFVDKCRCMHMHIYMYISTRTCVHVCVARI